MSAAAVIVRHLLEDEADDLAGFDAKADAIAHAPKPRMVPVLVKCLLSRDGVPRVTRHRGTVEVCTPQAGATSVDLAVKALKGQRYRGRRRQRVKGRPVDVYLTAMDHREESTTGVRWQTIDYELVDFTFPELEAIWTRMLTNMDGY